MGLAATAVINYDVNTRESKGVSICPGPNMAYLAILSASDGRKAGFATTLGIALGLSFYKNNG